MPGPTIGKSPRRRAIAISLAVLCAGCLGSDPETLRLGDPAPEFRAVSLETGDSVALASYRGNPVLVNLWATWCLPCRTETPYLQSLFERYGSEGLRIVGISVDAPEDSAAVRTFVQGMGVEYDILLDPEGRSEAAFQAVRGLPNSVLIDRDGRVVFSWFGGVDEADSTFVAGLERTLAGRD